MDQHEIRRAQPGLQCLAQGAVRSARAGGTGEQGPRAGAPRQDHEDEEAGACSRGKLLDGEGDQQHRRREAGQGVPGQVRCAGAAEDVEHEDPEHGRQHPGPEQKPIPLEQRSDATSAREIYRHDYEGEREQAVHPFRASPHTAAGQQSPPERNRDRQSARPGQRLGQPVSRHPPAAEARGNLRVPGSDGEHREESQPCHRPAALRRAGPAEPGKHAAPREQEEVMGEQSSHAEAHPREHQHRTEAAPAQCKSGRGECRGEDPQERVHPSLDGIEQAHRREGEEQHRGPAYRLAAEVPPEPPDDRHRHERARHGKQVERRVAGAEQPGPGMQQQVVQRRIGVGQRDRSDHAGGARRLVLVLDVATECARGHRRFRLHEVAQRGPGLGCRMLQTVSGGHRQ